MKAFLEKKKGRRFRIIVDMNAQKQPTHWYEGELITLVEDILILKDVHLGEVAINPHRIASIQQLESAEPANPFAEQGP